MPQNQQYNQQFGTTPTPFSFFGPPSRGRAGGLIGVLEQFLGPELARTMGQRGPIEEAFLGQTLTPGSLYGAASEAAAGRARELFAPGGEVASLVGRARGGSIQRGFNPESAVGAEDTILRGATQQVSNTFAQQAAALESQRFNALTGAYGESQQSVRDLIESLFTGTAGISQLDLAKKHRGLLDFFKI